MNNSKLRIALSVGLFAGVVTLGGCASPGGYSQSSYGQDVYGQDVYSHPEGYGQTGAYGETVVYSQPEVYAQTEVYRQPETYARTEVYSAPDAYAYDGYSQQGSQGVYSQSEVYARDDYRPTAGYRDDNRGCNDCGRVTDIFENYGNQSASGVGAVTGAVIGGVLGNQIGSGDGRKAATAVGAVAGGVAGHRIEQNSGSARSYEVHVQLDDGRRFIQQLRDIGNLRVGSYVSISGGLIREY